MVDIQGALDFVGAHGAAHHIALAGYAIGALEAAAVLTALAPLQHPDGSWGGLSPSCPAPQTGVACAWQALQILRWISADNNPLVHRTGDYLAGTQHADGYWDDTAALPAQNASPAARRMWLTAANARLCVETGQDTSIYLGRALSYLSEQWEAGALHGRGAPLHPLWMMLPLFKRVGQPTDEAIVEACQLRLRAAVIFAELDPMDLTAVAHAALQTRYAGNALYIDARDRVLEHQQSDGGWATDYGESYRPAATVDALMLLRLAGLL